MDLIERYLGAVRWNLPSSEKADDIIAELRDLIASRIEEREEALDRPLSRDETSKLLQEFGHPLVVAAGYGKQQSLIGPDIFPFYFFSLKIVLGISAAVLIVQAVANALFSHHLVQAMAQGFDGALWTLLAHAGLVTLIFAVIERTGWLSEHLNWWKPEQLPDLSDFQLKPKKLWEAAFGVAAGVAFLLWWGGVIHLPKFASENKGLLVEPGAIWMQYWWPIFLVAALGLLISLVELLRPRWRGVLAALTVACAAAGIALLASVYRAGGWVTVTSTGMDPDKVASVERALHLGLSIAFLVCGVTWAIQALVAVWRLVRSR